MISVVCVYNNEAVLKDNLLKSLESQTAEHESILIDNVKGRFKSAAEALNWGGSKAKGKYIMFVHQDVELGSDSWLENAEKILDAISDLGIAGVAGIDRREGNYIDKIEGYISDSGKAWGRPIEKAEEVQTLDECLLIIPKSVFSKLQFDEKNFDNWHCYGADYCLSVKQMGLKTYVIPGFIYHRSLRFNARNLLKYQKRLYSKHRKTYKTIYTTCGEISWLRLRLNSVIETFSPFYIRLFPNWTEYLKRELAGCNRVLDLGCGYNSPLRHCNISFSVGIEAFGPYLEESKKKSIHSQYIKADITKLEFKPKSFDAVLCSEVLEHLTKEKGNELIDKMQEWAKRKVIITTPNGHLWQKGYDNNILQEHKSAWSVEELRKFNFNVFGIGGWKKLRGPRGSIIYRPTFLWAIISDISQKIAYSYPSIAFQLLAIKQMESDDMT